MCLLFDFELAGVPLTDDEATIIKLLEFRKDVVLRLIELGEEIDQFPDGIIIMNYFYGNHLENHSEADNIKDVLGIEKRQRQEYRKTGCKGI